MLNKYDTNFDKILGYNEFLSFSKSLGISPKILMIDIDANHDGVISKEEVLNYLKTKTNGQELTPIFNKYATRLQPGDRYVLTINGLKKFFHEIQEEPISELEAYQLVIDNLSDLARDIRRKINKKIEISFIANNNKIKEADISKIFEKVEKKYKIKNINLLLNLREFNNLLNSVNLTVYNLNKFKEKLDLDKPLTDYFINSTHNTYITGHQLAGQSDAKMYSLSLLEGYRLVELDCYNGLEDDIIITHGYSLITKLKLVDVLHELKSTAFTYSSMPIILSIENHLDEYHQNIMVKKFKEILVDLYILPSDSKPDHLPTLREMQKKFIIKCGGKRLWQNDTIERKIVEPKNVLKEVKFNKIKKYVFWDKFTDVVDSDEEDKENIKKDEDKDFLELRKIYRSISNLNKKITIRSSSKDIRELYSMKTKLFKNKTEGEKETETFPSLEKIRGLLGTKFKFSKISENNYKPWECLTLKCNKFIKYHSNPLKQNEIIKLSQHCVLKAYPSSFNSDNYDIIKCWRCGCQAASLNIQALEDDFTLFNTVFFYQNRKCGYVLKPKRLLDPSIIIDNEKSNYTLKMKIISIYNLINLIENEDIFFEKGKLYMEIYSLGAEGDDKNPHQRYQLSGGFIFPIIMNNSNDLEFPIYEEELGGIMIKFTYDSKMIGRGCIPYCLMKNGYRKIPIFDNDCYICEGVFVLGYFQKRKN